VPHSEGQQGLFIRFDHVQRALTKTKAPVLRREVWRGLYRGSAFLARSHAALPFVDSLHELGPSVGDMWISPQGAAPLRSDGLRVGTGYAMSSTRDFPG